jgi:hypothetical protein
MRKAPIPIAPVAPERLLALALKCGPRYCQSSPGECCDHLRKTLTEQWQCHLFPNYLSTFTILEDRYCWALRCDACLEAEALHKKTAGGT